MAKRLDKFTKAFQTSRTAFLLLDVLTDGSGEMVDLVCRFANAPAAAALDTGVTDLVNQRFSRVFPSLDLTELAPAAKVAFSGSALSFSFTTPLGRTLSVTCYQPMYGSVACILEEGRAAAPEAGALLAEHLPAAMAALELSRSGVRTLSFSHRLCDMTGYSRKEFLTRFSDDFSALAVPEDWPDLLQALLDALREERPVQHEFRLKRRTGDPLWVDLRAETVSRREGTAVLYAALLDIDRRKQSQARLEETLRQLESVRDQSNNLFDSMPGSGCILFFPHGGQPRILRISAGLETIFGIPAAAIAGDLAGPVLPADREGLREAAHRAMAAGEPLRHTFRARRSDGALLWLEMRGVFHPQADGVRVYISIENITDQRRQEAELRQYREFTDLLLQGADAVTLDYDPATDTAHIAYPRTGGGRDARVLTGYVAGLRDNEVIHPEDRRALASQLRRMSAKPGQGTFLFRSCRLEQGWRSYRATCAPIFDERGNVYRILGKAVDVTAALAAEERFRDLTIRQKKLARQALATARLDLSSDRILDAKGTGRHLTRVLFGNTAEECLLSIRNNIPFPDEQAKFDQLFQREGLLQAFRRGNTHFGLPHHITVGSGVVLNARSMLEVAENPETRQVEAFLAVVNTEPEHLKVRTLEALLRREGRQALAVRPATGRCTPLLGDSPDSYAALEGPPMADVLAALESAPAFPWHDGERQLTFSWLDEAKDLLLVTVQYE